VSFECLFNVFDIKVGGCRQSFLYVDAGQKNVSFSFFFRKHEYLLCGTLELSYRETIPLFQIIYHLQVFNNNQSIMDPQI